MSGKKLKAVSQAVRSSVGRQLEPRKKVRLKPFVLNVRQTRTFQEIIVPGHCISNLCADSAESIRKRRPRKSFQGKEENRNFAHVSATKVSIPCDGEVFEKRLLPGDIFRIGRIKREIGAQRIEKKAICRNTWDAQSAEQSAWIQPGA